MFDFDFHKLATYVFHFVQKWGMAISDPRNSLVPHPREPATIDALEFYFGTVILAFFIQAPFLLGQKGEEKARFAATAIIGSVSGAMVAMSWHLAFSWMGGAANFAGTWVGYVYAGAPYVPLIALASVLTFSALPPDLRHYALTPATAPQAFKRGFEDPRTSKGLVVLGSLSSICIGIWSMIVQLRNMRFVHRLTGLRFVGAIAIALIMTAILAPVLKALASGFSSETADLPADMGGKPPTNNVIVSGSAVATEPHLL